MSEFSRRYDLRGIPASAVTLSADAGERAALSRRFGLVAIDRLDAVIELIAEGQTVRAKGRLTAAVVQSCAVSGEDLAVSIDEPVNLRFVPAAMLASEAEEVELEAEDLDDIAMDGGSFDLGEAMAQTLALAIDPYLTGPNAEKARREAGLSDPAASGPFAALAALKKSSD